MSLTEFGRHSKFIVEVGEGAVGVFRSCVEDCLCGLLDFHFLFGGGVAPWEVVVDDVYRIAIVAF